jgi:hypothetical protein
MATTCSNAWLQPPATPAFTWHRGQERVAQARGARRPAAAQDLLDGRGAREALLHRGAAHPLATVHRATRPQAHEGLARPRRIRAMDSLSQLALGAAVGVAVMGRRTAVWKAACGAALPARCPTWTCCSTTAIRSATWCCTAAETHALFWQTLFSLPLAAAVARLHGEWALWRRWWLALWLVLVTHPLLDAMTVYGTQLALPFSEPSLRRRQHLIIDPLYTLPLLVGAVWALASRGSAAGLRANVAGLALSTAYLGWGVAAQQHVERIARASLQAQGMRPSACWSRRRPSTPCCGAWWRWTARTTTRASIRCSMPSRASPSTLRPRHGAGRRAAGHRRRAAHRRLQQGLLQAAGRGWTHVSSATCAWARSRPTSSASRWPSGTARRCRWTSPSSRPPPRHRTRPALAVAAHVGRAAAATALSARRLRLPFAR